LFQVFSVNKISDKGCKVLNVTMQGQAIGLDQFKDFVSAHADHHATRRQAKPTPMAKAVK
jgi:hypothetical protein